jgi:hypothetical protein
MKDVKDGGKTATNVKTKHHHEPITPDYSTDLGYPAAVFVPKLIGEDDLVPSAIIRKERECEWINSMSAEEQRGSRASRFTSKKVTAQPRINTVARPTKIGPTLPVTLSTAFSNLRNSLKTIAEQNLSDIVPA